jgi:hypothetical protein
MSKVKSVKQTGSASKSANLQTPFTDAIVKKGGGHSSPKPTQPACAKS